MSENKEYVSQALDNGTIHISSEVIVSIAAMAAQDVEGVYGLGTGADINMLKKKNASKEIRVEISELVSRIRELETQLEKMKCCGNCVHFDFNEPNYCHKGVYRERQYVCSKWEFGN